MARKLQNRALQLLMEKERKTGKRIRNIEIAQETGLAASIISRWMNNQVERFDAHIIERLCDYFECEIGDLLYLEPIEDGVSSN